MTIGFGDEMPDQDPRLLLVKIVPFVIGLALVSMVISMLNAKVQQVHDKIDEEVASDGVNCNGTSRAYFMALCVKHCQMSNFVLIAGECEKAKTICEEISKIAIPTICASSDTNHQKEKGECSASSDLPPVCMGVFRAN